MLRVGLTGGLGSGKSTVAALLARKGAFIIEADELGRKLMEPGQKVFVEIVARFGPGVVAPNGQLDRAQLARLAFENGRVQELNTLIHPAVIQAQFDWADSIFRAHPDAITVVASALIFEVERDARLRGESETLLADWRRRFDFIVVVTAPEETRIARYVAKFTPSGLSGAELAAAHARLTADARARIAQQMPQEEKARRADFTIENHGDEAALRREVDALWLRLKENQKSSGSVH